MKVEQQDLERLKQEIFDKIDDKFGGVDEKFGAIDEKFGRIEGRLDALDEKIDSVKQELLENDRATRDELIHVINATALGLEHRIDKKLDAMVERVERVAETAADRAVQRVIGTVWERAAYDAGVAHDKQLALESRLEAHISDENVHLTPGTKR